MSKVTDARIGAIKALFGTGGKLTEDNFADLIDAIQEAAQEHQHVSDGGAESDAGDAGPVINLQSGAAAEKPETPAVGDIYVETDTSKVYTCYSAGNWTEVGGGGGGAPTDASYVTLDAEDGLSAETRHRNITGADLHDPKAHAASHQAGGSDPIQDATETDKGIVELATVAEAQAGMDTTRAVTAAGLLVRKVDTAVIGGDVTGNARGANALDIQSTRSQVTQVAAGLQATAVGASTTASGDYSVAIGYKATASGNYSVAAGRYTTASDYSSTAVGSGNTASGYYGIAIGIANTASGKYSTAIGLYNYTFSDYSMAIGYGTDAFAEKSLALGYGAKSGIPTTTNICGPQIIRKDRGENANYTFYSFCGVEVVLMSKEIALKTVADQTLTLPAGCRFWPDEIGIIATDIEGLTTQPTVRFGITGDLDKHHAAAITTKLTAAGKREKFDPAAGATVKGRFYWKGMLVEDE